jgi:hypothetical protein
MARWSYRVDYAPSTQRMLSLLYLYVRGEDRSAAENSDGLADAVRMASDEIHRLLTHGPDSYGHRIPVDPAKVHGYEIRLLTVYPLSVRYAICRRTRRIVVTNLLWLPCVTAGS